MLAIAAGLAAAGLLVAGCAGSTPARSAAHPAASTFAGKFVAYAVCMRSHGERGYPDPSISSSAGEVHIRISPGSLDPNSQPFRSADTACHTLLPDGGGPGPAAAGDEQQAVRYAACMRAHGVPGFPDPDHDGAFTLPPSINPQAPQYGRAAHACLGQRPRSLTIDQGQVGS